MWTYCLIFGRQHSTKVKKARENKGISQEKMSDILEISQSKYCRFENNRTFLNWDKIPLLAETLDLNVTDLISNKKNVLYIHKPNNQSGYIENQTITNNEAVDKITQLYEKIILEKDTIIDILKNKS